MSDPNIEPVKLIDFDKETLSEMAFLAACRVTELIEIKEKSCGNVEVLKRECQDKIDRAMVFRTQLLHAFSVVKEREKVLQG